MEYSSIFDLDHRASWGLVFVYYLRLFLNSITILLIFISYFEQNLESQPPRVAPKSSWILSGLSWLIVLILHIFRGLRQKFISEKPKELNSKLSIHIRIHRQNNIFEFIFWRCTLQKGHVGEIPRSRWTNELHNHEILRVNKSKFKDNELRI